MLKIDLQIMSCLLLLLRVSTALRLTSEHTVLNSQHYALGENIKTATNFAFQQMHHYMGKNDMIGNRFLVFYATLTRLQAAHRNPTYNHGFYQIIKEPDEFWKTESVQLHLGLNKANALDVLSEKHKLAYHALSFVMAVGANKDFIPKKLDTVLDRLLDRIFEFGRLEDYHLAPKLNTLDNARFEAICSLFSLIEFIQQLCTKKTKHNKLELHLGHVAFARNLRTLKPKEVSAIGHPLDVLVARNLTTTKLHAQFFPAYRIAGNKKPSQ